MTIKIAYFSQNACHIRRRDCYNFVGFSIDHPVVVNKIELLDAARFSPANTYRFSPSADSSDTRTKCGPTWLKSHSLWSPGNLLLLSAPKRVAKWPLPHGKSF